MTASANRPAPRGLDVRRADAGDAKVLWEWRNDPETRQRSFNKAPIAFADHVAWLQRTLGSEGTAIWIFGDNGEPVGQVRADIEPGVAEISIVVAPDCRGRGYGRRMLSEVPALVRCELGAGIRLRALVLDDSVASLKVFRASGFAMTGTTERDGQRAIVLERD